MKPLRTIRRLACIVAGLATAGLALGTASPAAFAYRLPPQGGPGTPAHAPAQVHTIVTGGTSGWQIVLIAIARQRSLPRSRPWSSTGHGQRGTGRRRPVDTRHPVLGRSQYGQRAGTDFPAPSWGICRPITTREVRSWQRCSPID